MQNSGIGVLGDMPPQRSVRDQQIQKMYGGTMELYGGKSGIGVLGDMPSQRSVRDQQIQKMYGGTMELYNNVTPVDFGPRTNKDMYLQKTYNQFYHDPSEDYCPCMSSGQNCPCLRLANGYPCMKKTCPCIEHFTCPYAKISDDPYNPYSYNTKRIPLN